MWMLSTLLFIGVLSTVCHQVQAYDSSFQLEKGERYIQFSGIAYCADPVLSKNTVDSWTCKFCKNFPNVSATSFYGGKITDQVGFVAYDPEDDEIIVSFSGTDPVSIRNWIDDIDFKKTDYPLCSNCQVHEGFLRTYESVSDQVKEAVDKYKKLYPKASITTTGHSLGAAMAALSAAELTSLGYQLTTPYTYGMPRVGDDNFSQWYMKNIVGTFRVTHHKDPVPHVPLLDWGFHHMAYEVFYDDDYHDYKVCNSSGEDESCANQYKVDANIPNHARYMGWNFGPEYFSWGCKI